MYVYWSHWMYCMSAHRWPLLPGSRLWPLVQGLLQNATRIFKVPTCFHKNWSMAYVRSNVYENNSKNRDFKPKWKIGSPSLPKTFRDQTNIPLDAVKCGDQVEVNHSCNNRLGQLWQAAFRICAPICSAPLPTALCPWTPLQIPPYTGVAAHHNPTIIIAHHNLQ